MPCFVKRIKSRSKKLPVAPVIFPDRSPWFGKPHPKTVFYNSNQRKRDQRSLYKELRAIHVSVCQEIEKKANKLSFKCLEQVYVS